MKIGKYRFALGFDPKDVPTTALWVLIGAQFGSLHPEYANWIFWTGTVVAAVDVAILVVQRKRAKARFWASRQSGRECG